MRVALAYDKLGTEEKLLISSIPKVEPIYIKNFNGTHRKEPAFLINRITSMESSIAFGSIFGSQNLQMNNVHTIQTAGNKISSSSKIPNSPKFKVVFSLEQAKLACEELGFPVVIKPSIGSWGRMVSKVNDFDALEAILEHKAFLGATHNAIYIQEYIEKPGRDIRAFVLGNDVIAAIYRTSEHWVTNTARGAVATNCQVTESIRSEALSAADSIYRGVRFLAVDLVESDRGLLTLEVNHRPEFRNSIETTGVNIPELIARYIEKLLS